MHVNATPDSPFDKDGALKRGGQTDQEKCRPKAKTSGERHLPNTGLHSRLDSPSRRDRASIRFQLAVGFGANLCSLLTLPDSSA